MDFFVEIKDQKKMVFHTRNGAVYDTVYEIESPIGINDVYIDSDSVLYGFSAGTLYKIVEDFIPLYYDIKYISFQKPIYIISNDFLILMKNATSFQPIKRISKNTKGLCTDNDSYLVWEERKVLFVDQEINLDFVISRIDIWDSTIFILSSANKFVIYRNKTMMELIDFKDNIILDMCVNKYLPVVAFLTSDCVYFVDINNKKIIKVIDSYKGTSISFKNKRELFIFSDKVIEYHLGNDTMNVIFEGSIHSKYKYFKLDNKIVFEHHDTFKEEFRTKIIENKIESKRLFFELYNEIQNIKKKLNDG